MLQDTAIFNKICAHLKWELPKVSMGLGLACSVFLLLAVYIWVLPIGRTTALRNLVFFSLVLMTLYCVWKYGLKLSFPFAWAWVLYGAVALFSLIHALDPGYSLSEIKAELGYGILAFVLGATWIRNEVSLNRLMVIFLIGNAFLVVYAIFQAVILLNNQHPAPLGSLNSAFGTFSTYLITVIPFMVAYALLRFRDHPLRGYLVVLLLIANLVALYYTISRGAVLALMTEIAIAAVVMTAYHARGLSRRRLLVLGGLALIAVFCLAILFNIQMARRTPEQLQDIAQAKVPQDPRITLLWPGAINNIRATPWTGGGFGRNAYKLRNPDIAITHPHHWHAHNVFLNKGVQMGIPGILAFALLLGALAWNIKPSRRLMMDHPALAVYSSAGIAMIGGVIMKNFTDDYFIRDNALMFWLLVGALAGAMSNWKETEAGRGLALPEKAALR